MKKVIYLLAIFCVVASIVSCKKCANCHYDVDGAEVELGETCGKKEIADMEAQGKTIDGVTYDVHCSEH